MTRPTDSSATPRKTAALLVLTVLVLGVGGASAENATNGATPVRTPEQSAVEDVTGNTPRSAMRGYLTAARAGDYGHAATYLDVRTIPVARRETQGQRLARELQIVLDRTLWIDVDALSDDAEGVTDDGLPPNRDLAGTILAPSGRVDVLLERVGGDGPPWKIAGSTVRQVPALYKEFGYGRLTELLPAPFFDIRFLDVQLWQWIGLLLLTLAAVGTAWLATVVALRSVRVLLVRSRLAFEAPHVPLAVGPARLLIAAALFEAGVTTLALPVPAYRFVSGATKALVIFAIVWLALRVTDVFASAAERRLATQNKHAAAGIVPLIRRTLKVVLTAIAMLAVLQNFGFNVTGLLAALGVGGLAVALAAQKTVENLFGGITIIADQPVRVGDLCRFGDRTGTVEDIGLRSTRLRTVERTIVSVPNAEFASMQLENFARRDRIWLAAKLALHYDTTVDQLRTLLPEFRKTLLGHPKVRADSAQVRFVGFSPTSLDVEVTAYVATCDPNEFAAIREDLFLRMMDVMAANGAGFAAGKVVRPSPRPEPDAPTPRPTNGGG